MKKIIAALSALMVLTTGVSATAFAACEEYDFNSDGVVNSKDVGALLKYVATDGGTKPLEEGSKHLEKIELSDETIDRIAKSGDVNGDGKIDINDHNDLDTNDRSDLISKFFDQGIYIADVNQDGKFDIHDIDCVLDYYTSIAGPCKVDLTDEQKAFIAANCDYNGDETVDALDTVYMLRYANNYWLENYPNGDANLDGVVDAVDASIVITFYTRTQISGLGYNGDGEEYEEITNAYVKAMGDINNDGAINALDASLILSAYADAQTK